MGLSLTSIQSEMGLGVRLLPLRPQMEISSPTVPPILQLKCSSPVLSTATQGHTRVALSAHRKAGSVHEPRQVVRRCSEIRVSTFSDCLWVRMAASLVLNITYGIDIQSSDDPYLVYAEETMAALTEAGHPGSFLVNSLPIREFFKILLCFC